MSGVVASRSSQPGQGVLEVVKRLDVHAMTHCDGFAQPGRVEHRWLKDVRELRGPIIRPAASLGDRVSDESPVIESFYPLRLPGHRGTIDEYFPGAALDGGFEDSQEGMFRRLQRETPRQSRDQQPCVTVMR